MPCNEAYLFAYSLIQYTFIELLLKASQALEYVSLVWVEGTKEESIRNSELWETEH